MEGKHISIEEMTDFSVHRGYITESEYLVIHKMLSNAKENDDIKAIGRCLGMLTRVFDLKE